MYTPQELSTTSGTDIPHAPRPARLPFHVGFISPTPTLLADTLSGMPARMLAILQQRFERVTLVAAEHNPGLSHRILHMAPAMVLPFSAESRAFARRTARRTLARALDLAGSHHRTLAGAARASRSIQHALHHHHFDVLFGCCISSHLYALDTDIPIVYFSDATPTIICGTYPAEMTRSAGYKLACDVLERTALERCTAAVYASEHALHTAITRHGLAPDRGRVVPMGAHVTPDPGHHVHRQPPRDRVLNLCITAADPLRKRLGFAVGVAETLRARGWDATLTHIGPAVRRARRSPAVVCAGRLSLGSAADRAAHQRILARSHFMLLPSSGEAYGIAPCEAAHFACPSVVSAVGGLPTVVRHGETGLVLPLSATRDDYADAIETTLSDPDRYLAMCAAARDRAHAVLSWDRWGDRMTHIIAAAAGSGTPPVPPMPTPRIEPPAVTADVWVRPSGAPAGASVHHPH